MEISKLLNSCSFETPGNQGNEKDPDVNAFTELLSSLLGNMVSPNQPTIQPQDKLGTIDVDASKLEVTSHVMQNQTKLLQELLIKNSQGNIQKETSLNSPEIQNLLDNFENLLNSKTTLPEEIVKFVQTLKIADFEIPKHAISPSRHDLDPIVGIGGNVKGNHEIQISTMTTNQAPLEELLKATQVNSEKVLEAPIITTMPDIVSTSLGNQSLESTLTIMDISPKQGKLQTNDKGLLLNTESNLSKEPKGIISSLFNVIDPAAVETEEALNEVRPIGESFDKTDNMSKKETDVVSENEVLKQLNSSEQLDKSFSKTLEITQKQLDKETVLIQKQQDIIDISVEKFKTLRLPGLTEVTVKFKPEELGEISLKLVLEKGQITGNIAADKKEVVNLLQANLEQLKTDLKTSNVNFSNITVNLFAGDTFNQNPQRRENGNHTNKTNAKSLKQSFEEEVDEIQAFDGLDIIV